MTIQEPKPPPAETEKAYDEHDLAMMGAPAIIGNANRLMWNGGMVRALFCDKPQTHLPIRQAVCVVMSMEDALALRDALDQMAAQTQVLAGAGVVQNAAKRSVN